MYRKVRRRLDSSYIGWNPIRLFLGYSLYDTTRIKQIDLNFKLGEIRNCSYSNELQTIGITAATRVHGEHIVATYDVKNALTRIMLRLDDVLYHALNQAGTRICYTRPSPSGKAADLWLLNLPDEHPRLMGESAVWQGSIPAWFPDDEKIMYQTPDGIIEVLNRLDGTRKALLNGEKPSLSWDGTQIAFRRGGDLYIWSYQDRIERRIQLPKRLRSRSFTANMSWLPDGTHLSFGFTAGVAGKDTDFYLLNLETETCWKTKPRYLTGLLLIGEES